MRRALLLLIAILGTAEGTSAQELEGRLKRILDSGVVRFSLPVGRESIFFHISERQAGRVFNRSLQVYRRRAWSGAQQKPLHRMGAG